MALHCDGQELRQLVTVKDGPVLLKCAAVATRIADFTVVLAEFVPRHFWEYLLHNQAAARLKLRLFFRRNTVVVDVPYHLGGQE